MDTSTITAASTFAEVDDALYQHEAPYYGRCATDLFFNPKRDFPPEWHAERARLSELYKVKYAEKFPERMPKPRQSTWTRMINAIRSTR